MSYEERRKNNTYTFSYENDLGDHDLYFYNPDTELYYVARNKDYLNPGDMLLTVDEIDLPQAIRNSFEAMFGEIKIEVD